MNDPSILFAPKNIKIKFLSIPATGSIGKILIEKFLRSCPDINKVYILIRPKKGVSIQNRLSQLFNVPLFDLIREQNPDAFEKVVPIFGDIKTDELGISVEDQNVLCQEVDVVVHSAATVRFDEDLKEAFEINVKGTQKLVNLSRKMSKIEVRISIMPQHFEVIKHIFLNL